MMRIIPIEGFDFNHLGSYPPLIDLLKSVEGFTQHRLKDSYGGHEVWGFSLGELSKPTIMLDAQIHSNHEWNTAHWMYAFMQLLDNPNGTPYKAIIDSLKAKYSFYIIPCVNPDGYHRGIHKGSYNDNGVHIDLNFDFRWHEYNGAYPHRIGAYPFSEPETQNIRDVILEYRPIAYLNAHCWGGGDGVYVRRPQNNKYEEFLRDYINSISLTLPDIKRNWSSLNVDPSSYNWAGTIDSSTGQKILTTVHESGNLGTTLDKITQAEIALNGYLLFCLHVDHFLTTNQLSFNDFTS